MFKSKMIGLAMVLLLTTSAFAGDDLDAALADWPEDGDAWCVLSEEITADPPAAAEPTPTMPPEESDADSPWRFHLTFYLWMTSLDATSTIDGGTAEADLSFSDIFDDLLEGAFSSRFEAWNGNLGLMFNFDWIKLGEGMTVDTPGPGPGQADVDIVLEQFDVFVGAGWRVVGAPVAEVPEKPGLFTDLYGGFRYTSLRQEVSIDGGPQQQELGGKENWIEPVIGARIGYHFSKLFTLMARADAGGFGWSDWPDQDIIVLIGGEFRFAEWFGLRLGYQWRWFDYSTGSGRDEFGLDSDYGGPWIGVAFLF